MSKPDALDTSNLRPPQQPGHRWYLIGERIICVKGGDSQGVVGLVAPGQLTEHHDEVLEDLTTRINGVIHGHAAMRGREDGREPAMIRTPDGWMLAWTENHHDEDIDAVRKPEDVCLSLDSDEDTVRTALGLV